jgi:hypothetical protein
MTMTDQPTMEQEAADAERRISEQITLIERLRALGRADDAADELEDDLRSRPACISLSTTIEVELYGGGPAGGIHFDVYRDSPDEPWECSAARMWHQDWFQPKGFVTLDPDVASYLWELWGLEYTQ